MDSWNLLIIMDDEHSGNALGCAGHPLVKSPNIDRLAANGTRFESAYTNSPICVPARAVFATGRYPHETRYWDNCIAYDGATPSWGHALQEAQIETTSIGKLHYLDDERPTGFDRQILPMHIHDGGDTHGLVRDEPLARPQCRDLAENIGPGETEYTDYDRNIRDAACTWLRKRAAAPGDRPWSTFVSFISPHYPLVAPAAFYDLYDPQRIPLPKPPPDDGTASSEWWKAFRNCYIWDQFFESDAQRRIAIAAYYGLISFIDDNIGAILRTLEETGLDKTTRVVFLSDHGENLGARGLWGKSTMYDESVRVPMVVAGPGLPSGTVRRTPVSLVDIYPTVVENMGIEAPAGLPGRSLFELAHLPDDVARPIFSEYHATAAKSAEFMLRRGRYKYIHYVGFDPELYDLDDDPEELRNLGRDPAYAGLLREFSAALHRLVDPEAVDKAAKADQERLIEAYGGRDALMAKGGKSATPAPTTENV